MVAVEFYINKSTIPPVDYLLTILVAGTFYICTLAVILPRVISKKIHQLESKYLSELEKNIKDRTEKLELTNSQLKNEISERQLIERELTIHKENLIKLAHYDSLTSLPNRVFFNELLNKAIKFAARHNTIFAVLFIDIDHFKKVNNACGHHLGDIALIELAKRFVNLLRSSDTIARLGGDEFIVLLSDIETPKLAAPVAEKLLRSVKKLIKLDQQEFYLTASIGIAIYPYDGESLEELQKHADVAMFKAKNDGGGVYQYYRQEMFIAAHEHVKLESALRQALENKEFELYYQPLLSLENGSIQSLEALVRWKHPELGLLGPEKFISFAEETGLIMPIGEWALREACKTSVAWQKAGYSPITIAVNISAKQFRFQNIAKIIQEILTETQLQPNLLVIEITETAIMENVDLTIVRLNNLHAMGVRISIDDFGTGYTSISYLKKFPVSILKVDQTFIKGIPHNQNDMAITSAVIALGHNLNLEVVAEGVETIEQMQYLAENNCDLIQGYFLSRPLPESKIVLQLQRKSGLNNK